MDNVTGIAIVGALVFGLWVWLRQGSSGTRQPERQLRRICFGDNDQVGRLINFEMTRAPGISRAEAASRAVFRHRRDNR